VIGGELLSPPKDIHNGIDDKDVRLFKHQRLLTIHAKNSNQTKSELKNQF
jgi:hypothetical protein